MTVSKEISLKPKSNTQIGSTQVYNRWVMISFVSDALVILASLTIAFYLRFHTGFVGVGVEDVRGLTLYNYLGHIFFGLGLMMFCLTNFRCYSRDRLLSYTGTLQSIFKSAAVWIVGYLTLSLILKFDPPISRIYCGIGLAFLVVLLPLSRACVWIALRSNDRARSLRKRAVVVGWNERFDRALANLQAAPERQFEIIGLIVPPGGFETDPPEDIAIFGDYEQLDTMLQMHICQLVIVADDTLENDKLVHLASLCEKEMIDFKLVPTCFRVLLSGLHLESAGGIPVLGISKLPLHCVFNQYIKRAIDIAGALVGLALSAPLIALFGILIYKESPGPIFYRQTRLGASGKWFDIIKLRSMKLDAEVNEQAGWTVKDDPRCLKVGALMRRLNIDEIPQFWNVLKGDMSLVGPRPERPELIEQFKHDIPHYNARHNIKPGITGWAQVNGLRGDTDLSERVRFDLHYIENWNVVFDFQIMALTFFKREGAC